MSRLITAEEMDDLTAEEMDETHQKSGLVAQRLNRDTWLVNLGGRYVVMHIIPNAGGGNCFFHALLQAKNSDISAQAFRVHVVAKMEKRNFTVAEKQRGMQNPSMPIRQFLKREATNGIVPDTLTVETACKACDVTLHVIVLSNDGTSAGYVCVNPGNPKKVVMQLFQGHYELLVETEEPPQEPPQEPPEEPPQEPPEEPPQTKPKCNILCRFFGIGKKTSKLDAKVHPEPSSSPSRRARPSWQPVKSCQVHPAPCEMTLVVFIPVFVSGSGSFA